MLPVIAQYHVSFPGLGIQDMSVNRTAFEFSLFGRNFTIYWYGLLFASALILCLYLSLRHAQAHGLKKDDVLDFYLLMMPLMVIGARLYYVAFEWNSYRDNPLKIFDVSQGGLAFYGGVIGGLVALILIARAKHIKVSHLLDFIVVYVPLGQGIGRWGNFFNQEAFGTNTSLPWGMISEGTSAWLKQCSPDPGHPLPGLNPDLPVHPTFLYEFIANMVIFAILFLMRRKSADHPCRTTLTYFFLYGIVRFFVEGIRTDALMFNVGTYPVRVSQLLSLVMVIGALCLFVGLSVRDQKRKAVIDALEHADGDDLLIVDKKNSDGMD